MDETDRSVEDLSVEQLEALLRARRGREHVRQIEKIVADELARLRGRRPQPVSPVETGVRLAEPGPRAVWRRLPPERVEFNAVEIAPLTKGRSRMARLRILLDRLLGRE